MEPNRFFTHPVFGDLNLKLAVRFLEVHTQHHLNGWKTDSKTYLADVQAGNGAVQSILENAIPGYQPILFRPPYGRLRSKAARKLKDQKIVMWNVLAPVAKNSGTSSQNTLNVFAV